MILHPGILALMVGGGASTALLGIGALVGLRIAHRWNPEGAEASQLALERQGWLVSSLVRWAVTFEALSLLLFLYTADALAPLFVGAMCATGVLNANPIGWHLVWIKLLLFLLGSLWIVTDHLDRQLPQAPLTRFKFLALLPLFPLVVADLIVSWRFFSGLQPEVISSCCGALFSSAGKGVASELAALPVQGMIWAFYVTSLLLGAILLLCRFRSGWGWRLLLAVFSLGFAIIAVLSVVAFISVYYYQLPNHHCPFDLLQGHYYFIGYPLYICLFGAFFASLVPAWLCFLQRWSIPESHSRQVERRWLNAALVLLCGLLIMVSWPLLFGSFTLQAYF